MKEEFERAMGDRKKEFKKPDFLNGVKREWIHTMGGSSGSLITASMSSDYSF